MKVEFELTGEMEQYAPDIQMFVALMLEKLQKNVHKGRWEKANVNKTRLKLNDELTELFIAIDHESTEAVVRECADVANYAMIIASIAQRKK